MEEMETMAEMDSMGARACRACQGVLEPQDIQDCLVFLDWEDDLAQ